MSGWVVNLPTPNHSVRFVSAAYTTGAHVTERRNSLRFDKVFTVYLSTADGMTRGIARNISSTGLFVETRESLPLGGRLKVTFSGDDGTEMTALCEVRYQVALNYSGDEGPDGTRGAGLRIIAYETMEDQPLLLVDRERVMH
jgi:hypothetical protein